MEGLTPSVPRDTKIRRVRRDPKAHDHWPWETTLEEFHFIAASAVASTQENLTAQMLLPCIARTNLAALT